MTRSPQPETPVYTQVARPDALAPAELDRYLARGWYRTGQALFTCRFTFYDGSLRPTIWTRVPLRGYTFRRSLRKLLRRNARAFRSTVGRPRIDARREALYRRYRRAVSGRRPDSVEELLSGGLEGDLFDTWELDIWEGDELVAFSLFDVGVDSVESIVGVYDPDYARASLGFYTMVRELEIAREQGRRYFYPGYVMPGEPVMDYKLRLGNIQFLEPETNRWRPLEQLERYPMPDARIRQALEGVRLMLSGWGVPTRVIPYPAYDLRAWNPRVVGCMEHPLVLVVEPRAEEQGVWTVCWHLDTGTFTLQRCVPAVLRSRDGTESTDLLFVEERRAQAVSAREIAAEVLRVR